MRNDRITRLPARHAELTEVRRVSALRRIARALHRSEARFENAFENAPIGMAIVALDTHVQQANQAFASMLGYSRQELVGMAVADFTHPEDLELDLDNARKLRDGEISFYELEKRYVRKDGRVVWATLSGSLVRDENGRPDYFIAQVRDIENRRRIERDLIAARDAAEAAVRARSEYLAVMSHEIRTPMNGVIGMTDLLLGTELSTEQREYVETIRLSGDSMLSLINDILDFSKIEAGRLDLDFTRFGLRACIEDVIDVCSPRAMERQLDLLYLIDADVPDGIITDRNRLRQILMNLVGNAIKFTDVGEVFVGVSCRNRSEHSMLLEFSVRDTGIGIDAADHDKLFRSFSQVDSSTARRHGGTGLGLAICERLTTLLGGRISVDSAIGRGSTFTFTIEARIDTEAQQTPAVQHPDLAGRRVLIVDDNETNRRVLSLQCRRWGMRTGSAASGSEALRLIEQGEQYELALIDLHMPGMDGVSLAHELRRLQSRIPMVMLSSGHTVADIVPEGLFTSIVTKPIKQVQLLDTIMEALTGAARFKRALAPRITLDRTLATRIPISILVAEDNPVNRRLAERILEQMGYTVALAENGREAVDLVRAGSFDLVFMDVQMPELDGIDATMEILTDANGRRPFIVAMTANAMDRDRQLCLESGMDDYISKPISIDDIQRVITTWGTRALDVATVLI